MRFIADGTLFSALPFVSALPFPVSVVVDRRLPGVRTLACRASGMTQLSPFHLKYLIWRGRIDLVSSDVAVCDLVAFDVNCRIGHIDRSKAARSASIVGFAEDLRSALWR